MAVRQIKTPPDAADRVYAQSLFELLEADGGQEALEAMSGELDELVELLRQIPKFAGLFDSRIIPIARKQQSIRAIAGDGHLSKALLQFLLVLNRRERINRFEPIAQAFAEMVQERFGRVEVDVWTRYPLPREQVEAIRSCLHETLQREPVLHAYVDESMIGGARIQVGDQLIDASVDTQLRRMRKRLLDDGSNTIRQRFDQAVDTTEDEF